MQKSILLYDTYVFYSWLRSKQHIKKSELHDLLQGRTLFYVYTGR
jgi:hypothetical protein